MQLFGAPDNLTSVVLVIWDGEQYTLQTCPVTDGSAMPLERRLLSHALRQLADAVDAQAEEVGD